MLAKNLRLSKRSDIAEVFKKGSFCGVDRISLKFVKNKKNETRVGVFVGVGYSKKAVDRNRLRRRIWAIIKEKYGDLEKGFDVVVMPSKKMNSSGIEKIRIGEAVLIALKKANLIKK